ncbi:DUF3373 family protein [Geothrix edaphica]|uniref:DUF3373 domain-containing protein n=1 Tax=Geothrix edaphica TaxID=2927976 RepID=A0ABQ5PUH8_9BACT|nr:DUF3373 family protein [Geothrix edaphica]GLH66008.1 hypothetical protein GETHED_03720 [Geothrix edaphica]
MNSRIAFALVAMLAPAALSAQSNQDLQKQIEQLKVQLKAVEEKAAAAQEVDTRLTKVETKVAGDNIQWGGDLRTRFESSEWHFKPYTQFMGFAQNPGVPGNPYPFMALTQQVPAQDWSNSVQWSTRLRLKMGITINEHAKIMGRLTMYKVHGGADVPTFNGSPNTVQNSFNSAKVPGTDVLRVERASLVYDFPVGILSIGRQNTSDGPPFEVKEGVERQATPQALAVNAMVDGIGFKFQLDKIGLPEGTLLGICYGVGYESGFGGGGSVKSSAAPVGFNFTNVDWASPTQPNAQKATLQVNSIGPLKDSTVLGAMFDMPLLFQIGDSVQSTNLYIGYNRMGNLTDIPFGSTNNFPVPAMPGMGGMPAIQYVTATNNLGDIDQWTATWKHKVGDSFTYFASYGHIKSLPNGKMSQYGAYWTMPAAMGGQTQQLAGFGGLLGDANKSQTASAYYAGFRWDPSEKIGFGVEFNHGSPRWWTYSPATGEATEKLGTRGDVWEGYIHWQFAKNAAFRLGYLDYKYSHAFSGWHISPGPAMPGQSWEDAYDLSKNPMLQYGFPATVKTTYASIEVKF